MNPKVRTGLTHVGTAAGAALATAMFLATKGVDLYAIIDQINVVVADITKLVALVTPLFLTAVGIWKSRFKGQMQDVQASPHVEGVVVNDQALANQLGPKVQTSIQELPAAAKAASSSRMAFVG